jgi:hypothetical protein
VPPHTREEDRRCRHAVKPYNDRRRTENGTLEQEAVPSRDATQPATRARKTPGTSQSLENCPVPIRWVSFRLADPTYGYRTKEQRPMTPQHARDLLHRLDAGAHHLDTPLIQEGGSPIDRAVVPERLKALAEQHGAHGPQIVLHQFTQPGPLRARLIRPPFQEQPARLGEERLSPLLSRSRMWSAWPASSR